MAVVKVITPKVMEWNVKTPKVIGGSLESHTPTRGSGSPSVKSPKITTQNTTQLITYQLNTLAKSLKCIAFIVMHW
jgi:hypothetical protein